MNHFWKRSTAVLLGAVLLCVLFAGCTPASDATKPTSLKLEGMKTEFSYGEAFSDEGLVVTAVYEDKSEKKVAAGDYSVDYATYNPNKAGSYSIAVRYEGLIARYSVTVKEGNGPAPQATPKSLKFEGMKTDFKNGEAFSSEGLTVTVVYSDKSEKPAEEGSYTVDSSAYNAQVAGKYNIVVTYGDVRGTYTVEVGRAKLPWEDDGVLKILEIGNSFTADTMEHTYQIAESLGIEACMARLFVGGLSYAQHLDYAKSDSPNYEYEVNTNGAWTKNSGYKISAALKDQDWDFIVLQPLGSGEIAYLNEVGRIDELEWYVNFIRQKALPNTPEIVWNMTWAYHQNYCETNDDGRFDRFDRDQMTMYRAIVECTKTQLPEFTDIKTVAATGTAIQNARTSYLGDTLTRDGYHLSYMLGRYIAGLTLVAQVSGVDVTNISWGPSGVDEKARLVAGEAAINAVRSPFEVTKSKYTA